MKVTQMRDDYGEILKLTIIFRRDVPPRGTHFAAPESMHHARWMAEVIYTFNVWMFLSQFKLTPQEDRGLRQLCRLFPPLYVEAWAGQQPALP